MSPEGVSFDGVNDYVDIDDWYWGGTTSFETYAVYLSLSQWPSRIFEFGSGGPNDNFMLYRDGTSSTLGVLIYNGATRLANPSISDVWTLNTWRHIVGVVSSAEINTYIDGSLSSSTSGAAVPSLARSIHWLGWSNWGGRTGYLQGYIAYLRI